MLSVCILSVVLGSAEPATLTDLFLNTPPDERRRQLSKLPAADSAPASECLPEFNTDYNGQDLDAGGTWGRVKGHLPNWQSCQGACEDIPMCKSWTFDKTARRGQDNCAVKGVDADFHRGAGTIKRNVGCCVSGEPCRGPPLVIIPEGMNLAGKGSCGFDGVQRFIKPNPKVKSLAYLTEQKCLDLCAQDNNCIAADVSAPLNGKKACWHFYSGLQNFHLSGDTKSETDFCYKKPAAEPLTDFCHGKVALSSGSSGEMFIYHNEGGFKPLTGHFFWDNNFGADQACKDMGYSGGVIDRDQDRVLTEDAWKTGKCRRGQSPADCDATPGNDWKFNGGIWTDYDRSGISLVCKGQKTAAAQQYELRMERVCGFDYEQRRKDEQRRKNRLDNAKDSKLNARFKKLFANVDLSGIFD